MTGQHTLGRWVSDRARTAPDDVAIDDRGLAVSYGELASRAAALARRLHENGYRHGDRIATVTGNSADQVVLLFACAQAGLVLVPLSWRLTAAELAAQLADADPALVCVEDDFATVASEALRRLPTPVATSGLGAGGLERDLPPGPAAGSDALPAEVADDDPLLMIYTSGTVRGPRGALLTHANLFWTSLSVSRTLPVSRDDVVLSVLPQFHVGGWSIQALLGWWTGARVVLERGFDAGRVLRLIADKGITTVMGVPANYLFLAQHPEFERTDLSRLRYAVVGGAPMPEALLRTWLARGVQLAQGYGLTEASPNVLCVPPGEARTRAGYAGVPYAHVDVVVADPATGEQLDGPASGELLVRGPNVFAGYWRNEAATAVVLRDGWLHTGDLVERDADGWYRIHDRVDDVFISGGENIAPSEIENVLFEHRAVADAAVIGRPDPTWGQVGVAYVVVRSGSFTDSEELAAHCRERLASFKVPRSFEFLDELPRSSVGKVLRRELKEGPE